MRILTPSLPGGIARYYEDWNPRAFGVNLTAWGTPVVLIESGAVPQGGGFSDLTRLNYVALLTALHALAADDLASDDGSLYEGLARNTTGRFVDVVLEGGRILQPPVTEPYRADVAYDLLDDDAALAGCPDTGAPGPSRVRELGDARLLAAGRRRDVAGRLLVPALAASVRGWGAHAWLSADALDAIGRLGIARVRWHVGYGLEGTMTTGIISAIGRSLPTDMNSRQSYTIPDVIQTDAPINPGNSGGVLLDAQSQVIGVTAAIESASGANAGIGFAIPAAIVKNVVPALINDGKYVHTWLGISGTTLIPDLASQMNLKEGQRGALVEEVMPNSPAEKAGLKGSDKQVTID